MSKLADLKAKRSKVKASAEELRKGAENGEFTPEIQEKFDGFVNEIRDLSEKIAQEERKNANFAYLDSLSDDQVEERLSRPLPHEDRRNTRNNHHQFSVLRAADLIARGRPLDGLEAEVTAEMNKHLRSSGLDEVDGNQFIVPHSLPMRRDVTSGAASAGDSIQTTVSTSMIEFLRDSLMVRSLGARVLGNLTGDLAIPKQTAIATAGWKAEGADYDESSPTLDQVPLSPERVGTYIEVTRKALRQSSLDLEMMVREDLLYAVANAIDYAVINGAGANNEPEGILQNASLTLVPIGTNGGAITWDTVVDLEAEVSIANALRGRTGYLTTPAVHSAMKKTPKETGYPVYILDDLSGRVLNGHPIVSSNQVPSNLDKGTSTGVCHGLIFGDWTSALIGLWGGSVITVNPYSRDIAGMVRLTIDQMADVAFRHIESFAATADITVS